MKIETIIAGDRKLKIYVATRNGRKMVFRSFIQAWLFEGGWRNEHEWKQENTIQNIMC